MNTISIAGDRDRAMAARMQGHDTQCIGAHADHRREDFVFPRQQSLAMRGMEWEARIKPIRPRVPNFVANIAFAIFA